jgi:hypothetical protein
MGPGAFLEPLVVVFLLFGGAWVNRVTDMASSSKRRQWRDYGPFKDANTALQSYRKSGEPANDSEYLRSPSLLPTHADASRERDIVFGGLRCRVSTPNTAVFQDRRLSRLLRKFPFLVECWYWALIYWVGQH